MNPTAWKSIRTRAAALAASALSLWNSLRDKTRGVPLLLLGMWTSLRDKARGVPLLLLGMGTLWLIATPNPLVQHSNSVKVGLLAWLVCKESTLAYLGYWIDRLLHPRSRPSELRDIERMAAEKRRAFIVCAAMLAGGLFQ